MLLHEFVVIATLIVVTEFLTYLVTKQELIELGLITVNG